MSPSHQKWAGVTLLALAVLHTLATLAGAGDIVLDMLESGWWRSADPSDPLVHGMQVGVFWSLMFGGMLALLGWIFLGLSRGVAPGRAWAGGFGVLCLIGAVAVPVGGFWIGLGLAVWLVVKGGSGAGQQG